MNGPEDLPPGVLDMRGLAVEIGMSFGWVRDHIKMLPHHRYGRTVRFDHDDRKQIRAMFKRDPADKTTTVDARPMRGLAKLDRAAAANRRRGVA